MTVSEAQAKKNLSTARDIIARRQGVDPSNLSYAQRVEFNKGLAAFIVERPNDFTPESVATARIVLTENPTALEDDSITAGGIATALFDEAASLNSDLNPFSAANRKWLLGLAVAGVAIYFLAPRILSALPRKA